MVRYDLTDFERSVFEPLLSMDRRGPKPKNNRQILNGLFYFLRPACPWRVLPERSGPYTTVYKRFNRWRKAGIWDKLMDAIVKAHDGGVQMIDSSIVRVHQHASGVKKKEWRSLCRSKPGRAHDENPCARRRERPAGPPPDPPANDRDVTAATTLLDGLEPRAIVIADKGYEADSVRTCIRARGAIPNIPNRGNRKRNYRWKKAAYRERNRVERFFNKLKQFRHIATRYDKLGANFFAFILLPSASSCDQLRPRPIGNL